MQRLGAGVGVLVWMATAAACIEAKRDLASFAAGFAGVTGDGSGSADADLDGLASDLQQPDAAGDGASFEAGVDAEAALDTPEFAEADAADSTEEISDIINDTNGADLTLEDAAGEVDGGVDAPQDATEVAQEVAQDVAGDVTETNDAEDAGADAAEAAETDAPAGPVCACGDGVCNGACGETSESCVTDCHACGDGACSPGEGPIVCPEDCCGGCGDGKCSGYACGEDAQNCPTDCGGAACGDGTCSPGEDNAGCPWDCPGPACGDGTCQAPEDWKGCPVDCGYCGDATCSQKLAETIATCPQDCALKPGCASSGECDDGDPCTADLCPAGACVNLASPVTCDDGDFCTIDVCLLGACSHKPKPAPCTDGNACTDDTCDAAKGCVFLPNAATCDDGDPCTGGDLCAEATCTPGAAVSCADGNPCTSQACDPIFGCDHHAIDGACDDVNACTKGDVCANGKCAGQPVACEDNTICTDDACDVTKGCVFTPIEWPCDDDNACTDNDHCAGGACTGGSPAECADTDVCTTDSCDPVQGCVHLPNSATCEDGDACTSGDTCKDKVCQAGGPADCDDQDGCTTDWCDLNLGGCQHEVQKGAPCDDGDACTKGDACNALGQCLGAPDACDDLDACTGDTCVPKTGCVHLPNNVTCDDANACTTDGCDPKSGGCAHVTVQDGASCGADGGCVIGATCNNGACAGGTPKVFHVAWGGSNNDAAVAVVPGAGGGLAVLTDSESYGNNHQAELRLLDASGQDLDTPVVIGTPGLDAPRAMIAVGDGYGFTGVTFSVTKDLWLVRLGPSGAVEWQQTVGTAEGEDLVALGDSGLAVVGSKFVGSGQQRGYAARYSAAGTQTWEQNYGDEGYHYLYSIAAPPSGGLVMCGVYNIVSPSGYQDHWLLRTNASGVTTWSRTFDSGANDFDCSVLALVDGYLIAGTQGGAEGNDARLIRTDLDGNVVWQHAIVLPGDQMVNDVVALADGFALTGSTRPSADPYASLWISRTDLAGVLGWQRAIATPAPQNGSKTAGHDIAALPDGFAVAGTGRDASSTYLRSWLVRTDAWGASACAESGLCATKPLAECDDAKPCTLDLCDAKHGGCWHAPAQPGAPCGSGGLCALDGTCVPPAAGMVAVPAGAFKMGCVPADAACQTDEKPQHLVTLDGFFLDVDLVTAEKYTACVEAGKCEAPSACDATYHTYGKAGKEHHPVNCVTWAQADAYCAQTDAKGRLPTEAEWEKGARGGLDDAIFPWGSKGPTCAPAQQNTACFDQAGGTSGYGCGNKGTCPAGFGAANGYGLHDMAGNVWEWVSDWYGVYTADAVKNPPGPASGSARVIRGGVFYGVASSLRASQRYGDSPSDVAYAVGFRCARSP